MSNEVLHIYEGSKHKLGESEYSIVNTTGGNMLSVSGPDVKLFKNGKESLSDKNCMLFPQTVENSKVIRELFEFTRPKSHKGHPLTIGLGDRLGPATAGHVRLLKNLDVFPVLAQQSMRELNLTGRSYDDVLAAVVWAVFREGYTKGYGADGDHLKKHEEVKYALDCGFTMITLDCSEHIRNDLTNALLPDVEALYKELPSEITSELESRYLGKSFPVDQDMQIEFSKEDLMRIVLVYLPAINHALSVYTELLEGKGIDLEISIDETLSTTTPQAHFFVGSELIRHNVDFRSIAPRFVGEFQKGIDYLGDVDEFEKDFKVHVKIANKLGYKISVHSGSDKFSIFPIVGKYTGGRYHLKAAGTFWLEAVRVIAKEAPELYREMHEFALENLPEARKYYYITCDLSKIKALSDVSDSQLQNYLDEDDARQVLHVTYGLILQAKNSDGSLRFYDRFYQKLWEFDEEYIAAINKHLERHLIGLGLK